ncbi:MAG: hypothetical protein CMN76_07660 [Spirochaetaceae bacterium]|nr:hypothetical protein [Spirochaetaceae bacterium]|tara:strand:- start:51637 stop:52017 length:381 start_codon:yes stop_codon:yes gene_type:complete
MKKKNRFFTIILAAAILALQSPDSANAASAIAYSPQAYGYSFNVATVEEAERLAAEMARKHGGIDVKVLVSTDKHGYGAIAADGNLLVGVVGYPDLRSATQKAISECVRKGCKQPRLIATWYDRGY